MIKNKFRYIVILKSRNSWAKIIHFFDPDTDLILTYDSALLKKVVEMGGNALYIDHLEDAEVMQKNNFLAYEFFKSWHLTNDGKDIFIYRKIPFGFTFRLEIWNDFTSYVRQRICLKKISEVECKKVFVGPDLNIVENVLNDLKISYANISSANISSDEEEKYLSYFFPIEKWIDERIRTVKFKQRVRDFFTTFQGTSIAFIDRFFKSNKKQAIFIQEYYPTSDLVQFLNKSQELKVVLAHFSWSENFFKYFFERPIPIYGNKNNFDNHAQILLLYFREKRCARLILSNGDDITEVIYSIIDRRISARISETLRVLDSVINYLDNNPIKLAVLIANIGQVSTMVDCVCRARSIPTYLIINGLMSGDFLDESKYATFINSYSKSIKDHYYKGVKNVIVLGDPRMDLYINKHSQRIINRESPTITIGASAHSIIDLNSYVAVEFDFMFDVLTALRIIKKKGIKVKVIIKTRSNGYIDQYNHFVKEFFSDVVDEIKGSSPLFKVLEKTDFYISLYSQSLFEASCLGIPCVYYKNDTEILDPPFDCKSELVTALNVDDLVCAINDFLFGSSRYESFLNKSVMEKYIGPLDGKNLERNLNYIYKILGLPNPSYLKAL